MYKKNKFNAKKTDGYDSKKEAKRAAELKALEDNGEITELREQVPFLLIPSQWEEIQRTGKKGQPLKPLKRCLERGCSYIADFTYKDSKGNFIVEDTKSKATRTESYKIKKKLMLYVHKIKIKEI